ncbi:DUF1453 domain-containing protein [Streptomyces orinoci]|uniref:DUF1453 domain-containing protein n=1 Tax=Streptomyces orinoci TaxID=67339 RepID=A0ABV3K485_STRON|nr:DUF1453 domain-containing protein [Streptomyces orinoci]
MSGPIDAVVIIAAVVFLLVRQSRPRRLSADARRWWLLPAVLAFVALRKPGLIDSAHPTASLALLIGGLLSGLAVGAAWAWTTRIWADESGAIWARGGKATAGVWLGGIALRLGLFGAGTLAGVHQGAGAVLLTMAAMLLARTGLLIRRTADLGGPAYGVPVRG